MKNKILYFPHINVPNSAWFTRMLLYWDEVGAIIPYDFIENPEKLEEHTRELVRSNLVKQVIPGQFLCKIPNFVSAFMEYIHSLGKDKIQKRREYFESGSCACIHMEKMDGLENELANLRLSKVDIYPWWYVENETAREFMAYLAATLGRIDDLQFDPVSDEISHLERFLAASIPEKPIDLELASLRLEILEDIFPAPNYSLNSYELVKFKDKYGEELKRFRLRIEKEIIDIANIQNKDLREQRMNIFKEEVKDNIETIKDHMSKSGFKGLTFGNFGSIVTSIPGSPAPVGLVNAVLNAFGRNSFPTFDPCFLYAAFAQRKVLRL